MKQEKISIDKETHQMLKLYCSEKGYKMGAFVARLIWEKIGDATRNCRDSEKESKKL